MQKHLFILVLLILVSALLTADDIDRDVFAKPYFPTIESYSSTDLAMGIFSGAANIWNPSPLSVYSNPAKLAFHDGIAFGYSYSENRFIKETAFYSSLSRDGIGLLLPLPTLKSRFGSCNTINESSITFEEIFGPNGRFDYVLSHTEFALGLDIMRISNITDSPYKPKLGIGIKYYQYYERLIKYSASKNTADFGILCSFSPINNQVSPDVGLNLELAAGLNLINPLKAKAKFELDNDDDGKIDEDPLDLLDNDGDGLIDEDRAEIPFYIASANMVSFAGKLSLPLDTVGIESDESLIYDFVSNLFSLTASYDNYNSNINDHITISTGLEFTLLDIFSYRIGFNELIDTSGYGINLNYRDLVQFQFNTARYTTRFESADKSKYDLLFRVDFMKLIKMME